MNPVRRASIGLILLQTSVFAFAQPQPGAQLWVYDAGQPITSSPALASDGTVYFGAGSNLYAITNNGATPSNKWTFATSYFVAASPAVGVDGTIYCPGGNLYALDPHGAPKSSYPIGASGGSPGIGPDGTIYVNGFHLLFALSAGLGLNWTNRIGGDGVYGSPAVSPDGVIYIPSPAISSFYAISSNGNVRWQFPVGGAGDSPAIGADGTIYVTAGLTLYAFNPDGTNLWSFLIGGSLGSPVIGKDGTIFVTGFNSDFPNGYFPVLRAITAAGALKWQFQPSPLGQQYAPGSAAIDSAGTIYYAGFNTLYAVSPDGQQEWTFNAGGSAMDTSTYSYSSPAIGPDGTIYVTFGSRLYAIAGTNAPGNTPWPTYRQNARRTGTVEKPVLKRPQKRADANFQFQLYGQVGQTYSVEASTNLNSWTSLTSVVVNTYPADVVDLTASNAPGRFYRTSSPP